MFAKEARKANKPHAWTRAGVFLLCLALTGTCIGQGFFVFGDDGHEAFEPSYEVTEEEDAAKDLDPASAEEDKALDLAENEAADGTPLALAGKESFVGTDGLTYSREEYFYLWIYDERGEKKASYSEWENPQNPLTDVLSYVDPDGQTYYLIPTSYFAAALSAVDESPKIEEGGFTSCPFHYLPDANSAFSLDGATGEAVYRSVTNEAGETAWYVRVQDTGSYDESSGGYGMPHRSNVCYTPSSAVTSVLSDEGVSCIQEDFWLWLYDSNDKEVLNEGPGGEAITDALTYTADGQSYHLLPVSYFSDALSDDGFAFDSQNTLLCPFFYIPSAYSSDPGRSAATGEAVYFSLTPQHAPDGQTAETSFYVRVQDTTGLIPHRSNVYYDTSRFADDAGVIYTRQSYYYLWIYDESGEKRAGYSEWNTQNSGGSDDIPITDVLSYEDGKQTYYLIPVSYFTAALSDLGYEFSEEDPGTCPLWYIPDANNNSGLSAATGEAAYYAVTVTDEDKALVPDRVWYVRVQDTGSYSASTAGYGTPHRSNVYYLPEKSHGEGCIVLNLGNGNGSYNFADYAGNNKAGADLRYTVDVSAHLTESKDGTFHATVRLPADEDLGTQFTVIEGENGTDAATAELRKEKAYDYRLIGWVDIEDGSYYDVRDGAAEADLLMTDEEGKSLYHVFYADWIAASYDCGSSTDEHQRGSSEETKGGQAAVSTADFVTIHMFDYNDLFNLYSSTLSRTSALSEAWSDSGSLYQTAPIDAGFAGEEDVLSQSFVFVNNGTADDQSGTGPLQWVKDQKNWNIWTGTDGWTGKGKHSVLDAAETWGIESKSDAWVPLLFDPSVSEETLGVHYIGDADYLFWIDEEGYYAYDSRSAAASYSLSDERFYVYDDGQNVSGTEHNCFLPYNSYGENLSLSANDGSVNYWFGMSLDVEFYLPNAVGEEAADEEEERPNQVNNGDMVFEFSGDDDIIIFIDDELTLDLSGNHDEAFGSINFSEGTVEMSMDKDKNGSPDPGSEYYQKKELSLSSGAHTLSVCYMERGGWASNLSVRFNVTPFWKYQSGPVQTVTAEKVWTDEGGRVLSEEELSSYGSLTKSVKVGLFDGVGEGGEDKDGYTKKEADGAVTYTYAFVNDAGEKHTFVYTKPAESTPPTLSYTLFYTDGSGEEITKSYTYTADDEGLIFDESGRLFAWLKEDEEAGEVLYLRIDVQTLSSDHDWFFAWEMLDADGTYLVRELSRSDAFAVTETSDALSEYLYWSVIGDEEIEESFSDTEPLEVILTEAAQEASGNLGSTNEALGYVIVAELSDNTDGAAVVTKQVPFSQISTLTTMTIGESSRTYYVSECGVTTQSAVESLGEGAVWYVVDASVTESDPQGEVEGFYLYCCLGGTQYWLTSRFDEGEPLAVTEDQDKRGIFYYNSLGELRLAPREGDEGKDDLDDRVVIDENGQIDLAEAKVSSEVDDVRIFTYKAVESSGFSYTAKNALLQTDVVVEKMDGTGLKTDENGYLLDADGQPPGEEHLLLGAAFILWRIAEDKEKEDAAEEEAADASVGTLYGIEIPDGCHAIYYVLTKDGGGSGAEEEDEEGLLTVCWTSEKEEAALVWSNEAGQLLFYGLSAGTYYLTEVFAPEGYLLLSSPTFTMEVAAEEETGSLAVSVTDAGAGSKVFGKRDVFYYLDSDGTRIYESTDHPKADNDGVEWLTETRYVLLNYSSYALPNTRGEGTYLPLFTAAGAALILLAAIGLMLARRSKKP